MNDFVVPQKTKDDLTKIAQGVFALRQIFCKENVQLRCLDIVMLRANHYLVISIDSEHLFDPDANLFAYTLNLLLRARDCTDPLLDDNSKPLPIRGFTEARDPWKGWWI